MNFMIIFNLVNLKRETTSMIINTIVHYIAFKASTPGFKDTLNLIQSIENAFESRSGAQYVSFKQLLRDIVLDLFDLINKAKEIAPGEKLVEFKIPTNHLHLAGFY